MKLTNGVYWVGVLDPDLRVFDIIMQTEYGTTYNAYLVKGQKTALIDTGKEGFSDKLIANIESLIDLKNLDYIVLNHSEPDHSGSLKVLLEKAPQVKVLGSRAACKFAEAIVNRPINHQVINDGEELDLGGKTLRFIHAPFLHWPDTIFTYLVEDAILFSCDVFGAHYCEECQFFSDQTKKLDDSFKYYYDHIMRPFKEYVLKALDKIRDLKLEIIAPSHGPVLRSNLESYLKRYRRWSESAGERGAVVVYVSAYGNTKLMAQAIAEGLEQNGIQTSVYDAAGISADTLSNAIEGAKALILGSPTINGDALKPIWDVINNLATIKLKGKVGAAFGSYGWSGEAVSMLTQRMKSLKFKVLEPGLRLQLVPSEADLEECRRFGNSISETINTP